MIRPTALAFILALAGSPAARAQDGADAAMFRATTVSLEASGEVKAAPDQAAISLGVRVQAHSAAAAMAQNRERMASVISALASQGVDKRDIQTSNLSLNAQYDYQQNQPARLTGYEANNDVTITVHDLARLGAVVDAVTASGANQVSGISFSIADSSRQEDDARREAVRKLRARADLYAQATGLRVIRLVNLSEAVAAPPIVRPMMMAMRVAAPSAAPTPVEPGEMSVRVQLSAVYELGQ